MGQTITFDPTLPWAAIATLAALSALVVAVALWRGLKGWWLRALAAAALLVALADPSLRDEDREVIGARFLLELTEAETAEALDIPRGTVKLRTSRALGRLRQALAEANVVTRG